MTQCKVAIIGAGPAGIACAIQLQRFQIESLLFEKNQVGGLLRNANLVENYLGFVSGISGLELITKFRQNLENLNIFPIMAEVEKVYFSEKNFHIETPEGLFISEILVVASGTKPNKPDISIQSNKIFYEVANLPEKNYAGKRFVIIGAGDAAFDYSLNLVNNYNVSEVIILNRNDKARSLPILEERANKTGKVKHIKNIQVNNIKEKDEELIISYKDKNSYSLSTDYVIFATGREPCKEFLDNDLIKNSLELQKEGLFYSIGDVINGSFRQTSIATADGIKAAMKINDYISSNL